MLTFHGDSILYFKGGEICDDLNFGKVMQINNNVVIYRDFCGILGIETIFRRKCH